MLTGRLAVGTALNLLAALLVLVVGTRLRQRAVRGEPRRAALAFSVWWIALGVDTIVNATTWLLGGMGLASEAVTTVLTYAALGSVAVMMWGLVEYLVYLFTGRAGAFVPIAIFYALAFVGSAFFIASLHPVGVDQTLYGGAIQYANQPSGAAALGFAIFFLLPPILGALAYGSLALSVKERTRRFRILVVAGAIFVWFASALVLGSVKPASDAVSLGQFVIAFLCIGAILVAYWPPGWIRRAWGIRSLAEDAPEHPMPEAVDAEHARRAAAGNRARRRAGLDARMRELV